MKANRSVVAPALAAGLIVLVASCSERQPIPRPVPQRPTPRPAPAPTPAPTVIPAPRPAPLPPPAAVRPRPGGDWRDAPITPGNWRWGMEGSRSVARFGADLLILSCERSAATVTLIRPGMIAPPPAPAAVEGVVPAPSPPVRQSVPMTILTSNMTRPANGEAIPGPPAVVAVAFTARDPVLDAMAFSRGRFAIETAGLPTLYVPSWPEIGRVVEDCR